MLRDELLRQVRLLNLRSRRAVSDLFAGQYSSAFKGRGMEFNEVRPYQPGDDVRDIDWNVTARAGEPFIKRFTEERELTVMLLADTSPSTEFGSVDRLKCDVMNEFCAVIATAASLSNDRVGLMTFAHSIRTTLTPRRGRNHTNLILRTLIADEDAEETAASQTDAPTSTDICGAIETALTHLNRKAILVITSDFLTQDLAGRNALEGDALKGSRLATSLRLASRKHDLVIAHAVDPLEGPKLDHARGLFETIDPESRRRRSVDLSSKRIRSRLAHADAEHRLRVRELARHAQADHITVISGEDYLPDLINLFHARGRRR